MLPLDGPSAWRGEDLVDDPSWAVALTDAQVDELVAATDAILATGRHVGESRQEDFPLPPTLSTEVGRWRAEVDRGRGFVLIRGAPVERLGTERSEAMFWGLGMYLGRPGFQDVDGRLLGHVTDEGLRDEGVRSYRTNRNIRYHCDAADIVGLLSPEPFRRGRVVPPGIVGDGVRHAPYRAPRARRSGCSIPSSSTPGPTTRG